MVNFSLTSKSLGRSLERENLAGVFPLEKLSLFNLSVRCNFCHLPVQRDFRLSFSPFVTMVDVLFGNEWSSLFAQLREIAGDFFVVVFSVVKLQCWPRNGSIGGKSNLVVRWSLSVVGFAQLELRYR